MLGTISSPRYRPERCPALPVGQRLTSGALRACDAIAQRHFHPGSGGRTVETLAIARHELRQTHKRTSFLLLTIGFPLVLLISRAGFGAINNWAQSAIEER